MLSRGSPVSGHKVHAKHDALLCVLPAAGGDHHHVAGYLRYGALKTHSLPQEVNGTHETGRSHSYQSCPKPPDRARFLKLWTLSTVF